METLRYLSLWSRLAATMNFMAVEKEETGTEQFTRVINEV